MLQLLLLKVKLKNQKLGSFWKMYRIQCPRFVNVFVRNCALQLLFKQLIDHLIVKSSQHGFLKFTSTCQSITLCMLCSCPNQTMMSSASELLLIKEGCSNVKNPPTPILRLWVRVTKGVECGTPGEGSKKHSKTMCKIIHEEIFL